MHPDLFYDEDRSAEGFHNMSSYKKYRPTSHLIENIDYRV